MLIRIDSYTLSRAFFILLLHLFRRWKTFIISSGFNFERQFPIHECSTKPLFLFGFWKERKVQKRKGAKNKSCRKDEKVKKKHENEKNKYCMWRWLMLTHGSEEVVSTNWKLINDSSKYWTMFMDQSFTCHINSRIYTFHDEVKIMMRCWPRARVMAEHILGILFQINNRSKMIDRKRLIYSIILV